jgi:hypothetical protein
VVNVPVAIWRDDSKLDCLRAVPIPDSQAQSLFPRKSKPTHSFNEAPKPALLAHGPIADKWTPRIRGDENPSNSSTIKSLIVSPLAPPLHYPQNPSPLQRRRRPRFVLPASSTSFLTVDLISRTFDSPRRGFFIFALSRPCSSLVLDRVLAVV